MSGQDMLVTYRDLTEGGLNLVSYLAYEGHDDMLPYALTNLNGELKDVAYGYAYAGQLEKATALLLDEQLSEAAKASITKHMIRGAARAEQYEALASLLPDLTSHQGEQVRGLAEAGASKHVTRRVNLHPECYVEAIKGYASGGHKAPLMRLLAGTGFRSIAIFHAALSGHEALVSDLLNGADTATHISGPTLYAEANKINQQALNNHAVLGYTMGCHFKAAQDLLSAGASVETCLSKLPQTLSLEAIQSDALEAPTLEELMQQASEQQQYALPAP